MSGTCCGQGAHLVADLALKVAGGWWTRPRRSCLDSQLLNVSHFELLYCWLARGMPVSCVHCECFQFRRCDTTAVQCGLETVLVSFVLSNRMLGTMTELSVEDLLRNSCVIHTNYMSTPTELCILVQCGSHSHRWKHREPKYRMPLAPF